MSRIPPPSSAGVGVHEGFGDGIGSKGDLAGLDALEASAFFVMSLGEATVRLAISVDPAEGRAMEGYKRMALKELLGA